MGPISETKSVYARRRRNPIVSLRSLIGRIVEWEYWPYQLFYVPVYFLILVLALRERSLTFFTASNPGMRFGGFVAYSKWEALRAVEERFLPRGFLVSGVLEPETVLRRMSDEAIAFPIICKPDRGERGFAVEKLSDEEALQNYCAIPRVDTIVQEYVNIPNEYGVLFYRFADGRRGVSSVVHKELLSVTGDGRSTLGELIEASERCRRHLPELRRRLAGRLSEVPPEGEPVYLVEVGNHARGASFNDANHLISKALVDRFSELLSPFAGFFIGRVDVRARDPEALSRGDFKVIEVNGVNSEPAHIYDSKNTLVRAYRDLLSHWLLVWRISRDNRKRGVPTAKAGDLWKEMTGHLRYKKNIESKGGTA